jgi:hypothetical protein
MSRTRLETDPLPSVFLVNVLQFPFFLYFSTIACIYFLLIRFSFIYSMLSSFLISVFFLFLATFFPSILYLPPLLHFSFSCLCLSYFHHFCVKNKYATSYADALPCTTPSNTLPSARLLWHVLLTHEFRFPRPRLLRLWSYELWHRVVSSADSNIWKEHAASIFRN